MGAVKKSLATVGALILVLSGCAASPEDTALEACKEQVRHQISGDSLDLSGLRSGSVSDELFEAGIVDEQDTSKNLLYVTGEAIVTEGSTRTRKSVICEVKMTENSVDSARATLF